MVEPARAAPRPSRSSPPQPPSGSRSGGSLSNDLGAAGLGAAGVPEDDAERPDEMDRTIVGALPADAAADLRRDGNPYAEGDRFLAEVSEELDLER